MSFDKREAPKCEWCKYEWNCFHHYIDKPSQKAWQRLRVAHTFHERDVIFYAGEKPAGLFIVCSGKAKIYKLTRTGQQLLTRIEFPGDLLGQMSLLVGENYLGTAEAMEESVISLIDQKTFYDFLKKHPVASLALLQALAKDVRAGEEKARDIAYTSARSRLGKALLRMSQTPKKGGPPVVQNIKRRELAEMTGVAVETTVRLLKSFEKQGLVRRQKRSILLVDEQRIRSIASSST